MNAKRREKKLPPRHKLEFQDWGIVKDLWEPWTEFYLNSKLHIIVCGNIDNGIQSCNCRFTTFQ